MKKQYFCIISLLVAYASGETARHTANMTVDVVVPGTQQGIFDKVKEMAIQHCTGGKPLVYSVVTFFYVAPNQL